MSVAVRGFVPREGEGVYDKQVATHIRERLQALERAVRSLTGGNDVFTSPTFPAFGSGVGGSSGGAGGGVPLPSPPPSTTTTIIEETSRRRIFLWMGS